MASRARSRGRNAPRDLPIWFPGFLAVTGAILGSVALYYRLPGVVVAWLGAAIGAWNCPRIDLTGKKDANGRPTPANEYEAAARQKTRFWSDLRWGLLIPTRGLLPGWPVFAAWVYAVLAAAAAWCLPTREFPHATGAMALLARDVDAVCAFILITQFAAARRRTVVSGDMSPGVRLWGKAAGRSRGVLSLAGGLAGGVAGGAAGAIERVLGYLRHPHLPKISLPRPSLSAAGAAIGSWVREIAARPGEAATRAAVSILGGLAASWAADRFLPVPSHPAPEWAWYPIGFVAGFGLAGGRWMVEKSLGEWREVVERRSVLTDAFETVMKQGQGPTLIETTKTGPARVDTLIAAPGLDAVAYRAAVGGLDAYFAGGLRTAVLTIPNVDSRGNTIPGTIHPTRFRLITWPSELMPDLTSTDGIQTHDPEAVPGWWRIRHTSPANEVDVASLYIESAMSWAADKAGFARPVLDEAYPLVSTGAAGHSQPEPAYDFDDQDPEDEADAEVPARARAHAPAGTGDPSASRPQAWATTWYWPNGPGTEWLSRDDAMYSGATSAFGIAMLVDPNGAEGDGVAYFGALNHPDLAPDADSGVTAEKIASLGKSQMTEGWWKAVIKDKVNPPDRREEGDATHTLANGAVIEQCAFVVKEGHKASDYFGMERLLKPVMNGAPFVSVTGYQARAERPGQRNDHAMVLRWSFNPVPLQASNLSPTGTRGEPGNLWVLAGHIDNAFDDIKLSRPQAFEAQCLTKPGREPRHLWRVCLRLYGGVTLADLRTRRERLRAALGVEWLRVEEIRDGAALVFGTTPAKATLARPEYARVLAGLEWQQNFLNAGVVGVGGLTPDVIEVGTMPNNPDVEVLDFSLPSGLDIEQVKAGVGKLKRDADRAFLMVQSHPSGRAGQFRILASEINPMPASVAYDYDFKAPAIPAATGIDGDVVLVDFAKDPHLGLFGTSGSGKSAASACLVYGALVEGAEVVVLDIQKYAADFKFAEPYLAGLATDLFNAEAMMEALYAETKRRAALNGQYGASSTKELPAEIRPRRIVVFLDEFLGMILAGKKPSSRPEDDERLEAQRLEAVANYRAKKRIGFLAARIAAEARSADIHLVLATQKLTANMLDDDFKDLKTNLARFLLGNANSGERMSALRDPEKAPPLGEYIPKGRGIWESVEGAPAMVQFWYADAATYGSMLEERLSPITPDRKIDTSAFYLGPGTSEETDPDFGPPAPPAPIEAIVTDLGTMDGFSLEDMLAETEDLPIEPATDSAPPEDDWGQGMVEPTDTSLDHADSAGFPDDAPTDRTSPEEDPFAGFELQVVTADQDDRTQQPEGPEEAGVLVEDDVVWDEIEPADWIATGCDDSTSEYGWIEVDALLAFLDDFPAVRTVAWSDPRLAAETDLGLPMSEIVADLLAARGVTLHASPVLSHHDDHDSTPAPAVAQPQPSASTAGARSATAVLDRADEDSFAPPQAPDPSRLRDLTEDEF